MIKELFYLIKLLFSPLNDQIEIIQMQHFPFKGYSAMSWCGKIITRSTTISDKTKNHERIHLEQSLHFKSWLLYYWNYLKYWNPLFYKASYYTNPFEMEAYGNEHNYNYRPTKDSWKKYIIKDSIKTYKLYKHKWREYCRCL